MLGKAILLDANLLVLLTVGMASKAYIEKHKRLRPYTVRYHDLLREKFIVIARQVIVTPNAVTEASNLMRQIADPARTHIVRVFRNIVNGTLEIYVGSQAAASSDVYLRLGIANASMLDDVFSQPLLLTADLDLYLTAGRTGRETVNFNHYIEANR